MKTFTLLLSLIALTLTVNNYAFAHKVNLFCHAEDGVLSGEGYFSGGRPAQNAAIEVYSINSDALVVKTQTDDQGKFSVILDSAESLKIVMNAGQGHKTEFIIEQEDLALTTIIEPGNDKAMLESKIQYLIEKKIRPLEQRIINLEKQRSGPGMTTIISGIGWIAGIFALIYLKKKKNAL